MNLIPSPTFIIINCIIGLVLTMISFFITMDRLTNQNFKFDIERLKLIIMPIIFIIIVLGIFKEEHMKPFIMWEYLLIVSLITLIMVLIPNLFVFTEKEKQ